MRHIFYNQCCHLFEFNHFEHLFEALPIKRNTRNAIINENFSVSKAILLGKIR
jgi:hypothetical protein